MEENKEDIEKKSKNSYGNEVDHENQQQSVLRDPAADQVTGLIMPPPSIAMRQNNWTDSKMAGDETWLEKLGQNVESSVDDEIEESKQGRKKSGRKKGTKNKIKESTVVNTQTNSESEMKKPAKTDNRRKSLSQSSQRDDPKTKSNLYHSQARYEDKLDRAEEQSSLRSNKNQCK